MEKIYNPKNNLKIITDLKAFQDQSLINKLTVNSDAYINSLYATFNLTNNSIDFVRHEFNIELYNIAIVRNTETYIPYILIEYPVLANNAPHIYGTKQYKLFGAKNNGTRICLYHPNDYSWTENISICDAIIPWTFLWVYFYEVWLETGEWLGKEYKH